MSTTGQAINLFLSLLSPEAREPARKTEKKRVSELDQFGQGISKCRNRFPTKPAVLVQVVQAARPLMVHASL